MPKYLRWPAIALIFVMTLGSLAMAQPLATESGFLQVEPDLRIFYQRYGTGTPKLFIPNRHEMLPTIAELLYFHDVVTWDPRGRGLSDRPDDLSRYTFDLELEDAEALRRHFGAEDIVYVGISLWGSVAMHYAHRYPESLAGVVALSPLPIAAEFMDAPADLPVHDMSAVEAEIAAWEADGRAAADPYGFCVLNYRVGFADSYMDLANFATLEAANVCQYRNDHFDKIGEVAFGGLIGSQGDWNWRETWKDVSRPVLLVYSSRDWAVEGLRAYTQTLPDVGWVEYDDAGHHVWNEHTSAIMAMIDAFVRGEWADGVTR